MVRELLASARQRRESILERVVRMAELGGVPLAQAVWDKTIKEVAEGTMGGPFSSKDILARHGPTYNLVPSFGLQQGVNEEGKPKFRRIDDHTAGFNNLAAERRQRIEMANIDYLVVMAKALHKSFETPLLVGSEDMQGAYRQLPLPDKQLGISITAVYDLISQHCLKYTANLSERAIRSLTFIGVLNGCVVWWLGVCSL